MSVRFDLMMVLTGVIVFLIMMIALYQKKYLLVHLLCSVHLVYMSVLSNMVVFLWCLGGLNGFSRICCYVGVEPRYSEGIFEVLCCERSVGVSGSVLLESSEVVGVNELWGFENFYFFADL